MKKLLLCALALGAFISTRAQVIFSVEEPASIFGNLDFTFADQNGWGGPDMTDPANAIQDTIVAAMDATAADSLACDPSVMANVNGKIALLYRGACQFGTKALNCQNAGAIAVVIVNNVPGAPINMAGGTDGPNVTIPVTMISMTDGAILQNALNNGDDVVAFIGSKLGFYANDNGLKSDGYRIAPYSSNLSATSTNASEFSVEMGTWVYNYGANDQTGITVVADVSFGGSSVFSETSAPFDLVSGDSTYVTFTAFSQASYSVGQYTGSYTINATVTDDYPSDDVATFNFLVDDNILALVDLDPTTKEPINKSGIRAANTTSSFTSCIPYLNANGSRLGAEGIGFSASAFDANDTAANLDGEFVEVVAYQWDDSFTDLNDANAAVTNITQVAYGEYNFVAAEEDVHVYAPFDVPVRLADNQRYLFCVRTYTETVFFGHDGELDYANNIDNALQPVSVIEADGTWNVVGFGGSFPAHTVRMSIDASVEEGEEVELTPYPNPANNVINIPFTSANGNAVVNIFDLTGKLVKTEQVATTGNLTVDITELSAGTYVFDVDFENGKTSKFNVVVTK